VNEMIAPEPAGTNPPHRDARVGFNGQNSDFRRLVTRGALLELVTFGFYRFWLMTNIRRHLWSNTSVEGDALEYTGRGRDLFIGFLVALAILVPVYLGYFLVAIEAERLKAFASLPLALFFYGFLQFAIYRARRYRLTRTIWRGVRFWMNGSGIAYAWRAFGWALLAGVTFGLAYPWQQAALERYKLGHTSYGDLPGRFDGRGWEFFKRGAWLWLLGVVLVIAAVAGIAIIGREAGKPPAPAGVLLMVVLAIGAFVAIFGFIYPAFKAIEWKWWAQGLRFGDVRFDSDLSRGALIGNYWKLFAMSFLVIAAVIGFMFIVLLVVFGVSMGLGAKSEDWSAWMKPGHVSPAVIVLSVIPYLAMFLGLGIVQRIYLVQRIWKLVTASITLHRLDAADHVAAKGDAANAFGEGLLDGLDIGGF